jgi:hypothetical protein
VAGNDAHNAFVQPLIDRYGYVQNGVRVGGGFTGYAFQFDENDFFRDAGQVAYNLTLGTTVRHELHAGFQICEDSEDLVRSSNGWGQITVPGGRLNFQGTPIFYTARVQARPADRCRPSTPSTARGTSRSRLDQLEELDLQPRPRGQPRYPVRPGPA